MIKNFIRSISVIILLIFTPVITVFAVNIPATPVTTDTHDPFRENNQNNLNNKLIFIHYGNAEAIASLLTNKVNSVGVVIPDKRTNSIWIQDTPENIKRISRFIEKIDIPVKQILIEARILNIDDTFVRNLGSEFGVAPVATNNSSGNSLATSLVTGTLGHYDFIITKLKNGLLIDMELLALESKGHVKIISHPKLITLDRETAYIGAGDEIPYQEKTAQGDTSIAFKKAVLGLKVTPEIIANNKILLKIILNQDKVSQITVHEEPAISTREINTQVIVNNKETVVLGGIYEQSKDKIIERIPILGSIPIIGALFTYKHTANERKELLIFITPTKIEY
jgi:type IV pilus assembly protein PilQ